uniref:Transposase IS116/IS110/IS902 C-terminal domain-containing protein n=1 Tax=Fervidobacterium nodosum TaxID=2424 RepID=A0A7C5Y3P0_9BACT
MISEVGDISKFESKEKFVSYIRPCPVIYKSENHNGISKKESKQSTKVNILQLSDKNNMNTMDKKRIISSV